MGLYILQENAAGGGYIIINEVSAPASSVTVDSINGTPITPTVYNLLTLPSDIQAATQGSDIDFVQMQEAMLQAVTDLGSGNSETGFDLLVTTPINEQFIAASNNIGNATQQETAIPNYDLRSAYGQIRNAKYQAVSLTRAQAFIDCGGTIATLMEFGVLYTITTV